MFQSPPTMYIIYDIPIFIFQYIYHKFHDDEIMMMNDGDWWLVMVNDGD